MRYCKVHVGSRMVVSTEEQEDQKVTFCVFYELKVFDNTPASVTDQCSETFLNMRNLYILPVTFY